jgi:hypothetical protein
LWDTLAPFASDLLFISLEQLLVTGIGIFENQGGEEILKVSPDWCAYHAEPNHSLHSHYE